MMTFPCNPCHQTLKCIPSLWIIIYANWQHLINFTAPANILNNFSHFMTCTFIHLSITYERRILKLLSNCSSMKYIELRMKHFKSVLCCDVINVKKEKKKNYMSKIFCFILFLLTFYFDSIITKTITQEVRSSEWKNKIRQQKSR